MSDRAPIAAALGLLLLFSAGCKSQSPEDTVRARWDQFMSATLDNDADASIACIDPAEVKRAGQDAVKRKQELFGKLLRAGKIKKSDLRIDRVTIGPDGSTAVVNHSMRTKEGNWLEQVPYGSWVKVDKTWYMRP